MRSLAITYESPIERQGKDFFHEATRWDHIYLVGIWVGRGILVMKWDTSVVVVVVLMGWANQNQPISREKARVIDTFGFYSSLHSDLFPFAYLMKS